MRFFHFLREDLKDFPEIRDSYSLEVTRMCVDGYARSSNTFLFHAMVQAGLVSDSIINHHHNAVVDVWSAFKKLPTLVPIRAPIDTVASLMIYEHKFDGAAAEERLQRWRYYYTLIRLCGMFNRRLVLVHFDDITRDVGALARAVEKRFKLGLRGIDHAEAEPVFRSWCKGIFTDSNRPLREFPLPAPELAGDKAALAAVVAGQPAYAACERLFRRCARHCIKPDKVA